MDRYFRENFRCHDGKATESSIARTNSPRHHLRLSHRKNTIGTLINRTRDYRTIDITCQGRPASPRRSRKDLLGRPMIGRVKSCLPDDACRALADFQIARLISGTDIEYTVYRVPPQVVVSCHREKHLILRSEEDGTSSQNIYARERLCSRGNLNSR